MYSFDDLKADIEVVVNYNWQDELRDYEECETESDNSREGHIFVVLNRLNNFLADKDATPQSWLTDKRPPSEVAPETHERERIAALLRSRRDAWPEGHVVRRVLDGVLASEFGGQRHLEDPS